MDISTYSRYCNIFEDIKRETSECGWSGARVEQLKKEVRKHMRHLYAEYGRGDSTVEWFERDMSWWL